MHWSRWRPDQATVRIDGVDTTWGEMDNQVARVAGGLIAHGIEPGDRVGILAANSLEWCQLALAIMRAGAVVVPLSIRLAPPNLLQAYLAKGVSVRQAYALTEATGSCCLPPAELALTKLNTAGRPNVHTPGRHREAVRLIGRGLAVPKLGVMVTAPARELDARGKNFALALLAMTQFVIVIDASIVNVALPSIGSHLHFSQSDLSWVVNAYVLTFGGFLLLGGRLADLLGRRRIFMAGLILFSLASLLGGLAQSEGWLIAARAVQGLGAAVVSPAALSIITTTFLEGSERNRALGVWGAVGGAGGAVGVLLGGVLTSGLSWRWVLFVNVPIGLICAALAPRTLLESRVEGESRSFDVPGAVTVTGGLALLVYAVVDAVNVGWGSSATLFKLAGAAVLIVAFLLIESRAAYPLMPFSIFRLRTLRGANVIGLLIGMSLFSMFFFISLYLQQVLHQSPIKAGLSYLPLSAFIIVSAGIASQLVTRIGFKPTMLIGLLFVAAGLFWFSRVHAPGGSYLNDVLGPSILAAIGLGLSFVSVTIAAVTGTSQDEAGLASGLINTSQQVGGALGLAILATVADSRTLHLLHGGVHNPIVALTKGFDRAFLFGSGIALAGAILALVMISTRDSREHAAAARAGAVPAPASA